MGCFHLVQNRDQWQILVKQGNEASDWLVEWLLSCLLSYLVWSVVYSFG
jgi:hypothetical protein